MISSFDLLRFAIIWESWSSDSRKVWKKVNSLLGSSPDALLPVIIKKDGVDISVETLPDVFSNYFTNISTLPTNSTVFRHIKATPHDTVFLRPTDEGELIFSTLKDSSTSDIDNLQMKPGKYAIDVIAPVLSYIYNLSLASGVFPRKMQTANVLALFKKGYKTAMSNYRPISILPIFSKA